MLYRVPGNHPLILESHWIDITYAIIVCQTGKIKSLQKVEVAD